MFGYYKISYPAQRGSTSQKVTDEIMHDGQIFYQL